MPAIRTDFREPDPNTQERCKWLAMSSNVPILSSANGTRYRSLCEEVHLVFHKGGSSITKPAHTVPNTCGGLSQSIPVHGLDVEMLIYGRSVLFGSVWSYIQLYGL